MLRFYCAAAVVVAVVLCAVIGIRLAHAAKADRQAVFVCSTPCGACQQVRLPRTCTRVFGYRICKED